MWIQVDVVLYEVFYRLPSVDGLGPKKRLKRAYGYDAMAYITGNLFLIFVFLYLYIYLYLFSNISNIYF